MSDKEISFNLEPLIEVIVKGQDWILERLFNYATKLDFVKYTSTLKEAWRISIEGLTEPLINVLKSSNKVPDFGPDEDFVNDPIASFGILEAQKHRNRGVTLGMFLGLIKYYRQSYIDLILESGFEKKFEDYYRLYVDRFFDRVELGFATEWALTPQEQLIQDLQETNRIMTNEKNKYLTIFESLPNPAFFINLKNQVENRNNSASILFGFSKVPGTLYYSEINKDNIPTWMEEELKNFLSNDEEELNFEKILNTKIGPRYFNVKMKKMLDASSKFNGVMVILNDLTKRIETEQKLKESEEKFRLIAEQSLVGIFILQDNEVKYINHKVAEELGYPHEEVKNWNLEDLLNFVHPEDRDFVREQALKKQKGEKDVIMEYEHRMVNKNGDILWVKNLSKTLKYNGRPADFVTQVYITEIKKAEEKLKESENRYRRAYDQANMFKDIIIHDINNILQVIQTSGELYSTYRNNPEELNEIDKLIKLIQKAVLRGVNLVSNARKLSQLEDARMAIQSMEMFDILHESINSLKTNFKDQDINIDIQSFSDYITIYANELISDVFDNILVNAVKYRGNTALELKIIISKEKKDNDNFIKIEFQDNGRGIPDSMKEAIFQRNSKQKGSKGLGFGLSLVKRIMESFGGKIWVENRIIGDYSQGSKFILLIPGVL